MQISGTSFTVYRKKPFQADGPLKPSTLEKVTGFAFDMTFGEKGQHRTYRTGGSATRSPTQILIDTFQGKLSEFALSNLLYKKDGFKVPDTSTHALGIWESADFELGNNLISVKSTKFFGNLLLLEKGDWDSSGGYTPTGGNPQHYSHIVLVRIAPDIESLIQLDREDILSSYEKLLERILDQDWKYEITGFITTEDLRQIIALGHEIPAGSLLNGKVPMDASNYYVQAGDLRGPGELLASL